MRHSWTWVFSPELFWLGVYSVSRLLASRNLPPHDAGNVMLERSSWSLALIAVPLSFLFVYGLAGPSSSRGWLTTRLLLATFIGLNASLIEVSGAIDYGDSRNSGTYGFWFVGLILGGLLFVACSCVLAVVAWRSKPA